MGKKRLADAAKDAADNMRADHLKRRADAEAERDQARDFGRKDK